MFRLHAMDARHVVVLVLSGVLIASAPFWPLAPRPEPLGPPRYEYKTISAARLELDAELARATRAGWEPLSVTVDYQRYDGHSEGGSSGRMDGRSDNRIEGRFEGSFSGRVDGSLDGRFVILVRRADTFPMVP